MTIQQIKEAIFYHRAVLVYCKHRRMKGAWEYFVIYGSGKTVKIKGNRFKSVNNWIYTRVKKTKI